MTDLHEHKWKSTSAYEKKKTDKTNIEYWSSFHYLICTIKGCNAARRAAAKYLNSSITAIKLAETIASFDEFTQIEAIAESDYDGCTANIVLCGFNNMTPEQVAAAKESVKLVKAEQQAKEKARLALNAEQRKAQIEWAKDLLKEAEASGEL